MSEHLIKMKIDRRGRGLVEVDGVDISEVVESVSFEARSMTRPVAVVTMANAIFDIELVGEVKAQTGMKVEAVDGDGG